MPIPSLGMDLLSAQLNKFAELADIELLYSTFPIKLISFWICFVGKNKKSSRDLDHIIIKF